MYRFVKANEESNRRYTFICERNNFIGVISDEIIGRGLKQIFPLSMNGMPIADMSYIVESRCFDEYTPSKKEIDEWLNYTEKRNKETHNILEETLCLQKEMQLLPEINIDEMF